MTATGKKVQLCKVTESNGNEIYSHTKGLSELGDGLPELIFTSMNDFEVGELLTKLLSFVDVDMSFEEAVDAVFIDDQPIKAEVASVGLSRYLLGEDLEAGVKLVWIGRANEECPVAAITQAVLAVSTPEEKKSLLH